MHPAQNMVQTLIIQLLVDYSSYILAMMLLNFSINSLPLVFDCIVIIFLPIRNWIIYSFFFLLLGIFILICIFIENIATIIFLQSEQFV